MTSCGRQTGVAPLRLLLNVHNTRGIIPPIPLLSTSTRLISTTLSDMPPPILKTTLLARITWWLSVSALVYPIWFPEGDQARSEWRMHYTSSSCPSHVQISPLFGCGCQVESPSTPSPFPPTSLSSLTPHCLSLIKPPARSTAASILPSFYRRTYTMVELHNITAAVTTLPCSGGSPDGTTDSIVHSELQPHLSTSQPDGGFSRGYCTPHGGHRIPSTSNSELPLRPFTLQMVHDRFLHRRQ